MSPSGDDHYIRNTAGVRSVPGWTLPVSPGETLTSVNRNNASFGQPAARRYKMAAVPTGVEDMSKKLVSGILFSALLACSPIAFPSAAGIAAEETIVSQAEIGKKAPDFTLTDIAGKSVKLNSFRGKFVVLEWFNDECPFVKKHYKSDNMQALQKEYTGKGVVWLTICSSAPGKPGNHTNEEYKKILSDYNAEPTHFLVDSDGKVGKLYGAKTTPDMFLISKTGKVEYSGAIDDKPVPDADSIKTAKNYIREALDQALSGKSIATRSTKSYGCSVKYNG
jgi:peroxiredoxin